jgi:cytochrome P450
MGLVAKVFNALIGLDPPEHTVHRRMIVGEFSVKRMQSQRPRIQEIVDDCIDRMVAAGPPVDLVTMLAIPVPSLVTCELLGIPYSDHEFFQQAVEVGLGGKASQGERLSATYNLQMYLNKLVAEKEDEPGDDLIGRLVVKYRDAGIYTHEHMVALAMQLLVAGHETTANMISLGTLALLENPGQLDVLRSDPAMATQAVDELLRYLSIVDVTGGSRVAVEDIEIGGMTIRKGDGVIALLSGANRDGGVYANPDTLDIERGARRHVAFGYGVHQCIGQNLARLELEIVFKSLFERIPELRLAEPMNELPMKDEAKIYGVVKMPVTW